MSAQAQAGWALASAFAFALMSGAIKVGFAHYGLFELVFYRNVVGAIAIGIWAVARGYRLTTPHWRLHGRRSLLGTGSMVLWFVALAHLPLSTATTLGNTAPLFVAAMIAGIGRLRRQADPRTRRMLTGAAVVGFLGVLLTLRPTLDGANLAGFAAGLGSGALGAIVYLEMRALATAGEPSWRTVFWFSTISAAITAACTLATGGFSAHGWVGVGWLVAIAGFALVGQLCMTLAFSGAHTMLAANVQYTNIPFAAVIGALAFADVLSPREAVGIAVIVAAGAFATWASARTTRPERDAPHAP
jgi:drug/metabolite transporter (DMT)-like permease